MRRAAGRNGLAVAAGIAGALAAATAVFGQNSAACISEAAGPVQIYRCQEDLRLTAERAALVATIERGGRVVGFRVEGGAALVEPGSSRVDAVEIVTPHATTSVRGQRVAFDVDPARTSVYVREGEATVREGTREARLRDGEGVDVGPSEPHREWRGGRPAPGGGAPVPPPAMAPQSSPVPKAQAPRPLEVRRWSPDQVERLLTRLGLP